MDRVATKGGARLESLHQQRCLDPRLSKEGGGIAGEVGSGAMLRAVMVTAVGPGWRFKRRGGFTCIPL